MSEHPHRSESRGLLATETRYDYPVHMLQEPQALSSDELRKRLRPFCEKHRIRRLEVFGSAASGLTTSSSDVGLLVTLDESTPLSTSELLEMAGEAEELIGRPVDFVLLHRWRSRRTTLRASTFWPLPCACMEIDQLGRLRDIFEAAPCA